MGEMMYPTPRGRFEVFEGHGHYEVPLGDATLDNFWIRGCNEWLSDELHQGKTYSLLLRSPVWYTPIRGINPWDPNSDMVYLRQDDSEGPCQIQGTVCLASNITVAENDSILVPALILIEASVDRSFILGDESEHESILALPLEELPALLELCRLPTIF